MEDSKNSPTDLPVDPPSAKFPQYQQVFSLLSSLFIVGKDGAFMREILFFLFAEKDNLDMLPLLPPPQNPFVTNQEGMPFIFFDLIRKKIPLSRLLMTPCFLLSFFVRGRTLSHPFGFVVRTNLLFLYVSPQLRPREIFLTRKRSSSFS